MPPRKQAPGPRPKRGLRGTTKRDFPNPSSSERDPPTTAAPEIPAKGNHVEDVNLPITTSETTAPPPSVPEIGNQNAASEMSEDPIGDSDKKKTMIGPDAVPADPQDGTDSKILSPESEENVERGGNEGSALGEENKKKKKKVVKVVKKVMKKVMVKKLVPKNTARSVSERESEKREISYNEGGMISGYVSVPAEEVPMEVEKPELTVPVAMGGVEIEEGFGTQVATADEKNELCVSVAVEGVENVNQIKVIGGEKEGFGTQVAVEDEKKELGVSVGVEGVENVNQIEDFGGERDGSRAEFELGDHKSGGASEKLYSGSEIPGNETNVDFTDGPEVLKVSSGDDEGVKGEQENSGEGGLKEEVEKGNGGIVLSGELEALERRKRRKTEIFIGGLGKDAKEEDIQKVFEQVGEVLEVRLVTDSKSGKNKGFAFLRYASAADCKKALEIFHKVEICGKECGTSPVEGNDTLFLGNIDKKWKNEDVLKLLQEIGIEKIDKVTVMADPRNIERNRGFAFLELETNKDAQNAFNKLQNKDFLGKLQIIKVAWAEPLSEPDEEEMLKVKSVYAEYLPSSWDEEKVKNHFRKFGEIENVVLARNLRSSRRKDFAFVNFTTREAALACIESLNHEPLSDGSSKVNVKVSLAKPIPKGKPNIKSSNSLSKEISKQKPRTIQCSVQPNEPQNKRLSTRHYNEDRIGDRRSSATAELVRLYGQQDSQMQPQTRLDIGSDNMDYSYSLPGMKRSFYALADDPYLSYPREYTRARFESYFPVGSPSFSEFSQGAAMTSLPYYQRQGAGYTSSYGYTDYADNLQREEAPYHGNQNLHYRY